MTNIDIAVVCSLFMFFESFVVVAPKSKSDVNETHDSSVKSIFDTDPLCLTSSSPF